jgi:hypothetical protein
MCYNFHTSKHESFHINMFLNIYIYIYIGVFTMPFKHACMVTNVTVLRDCYVNLYVHINHK